MAFSALTDLLRQVSGVLQPGHGGTGHRHGSEWVLVRGLNSTGSTIARFAIVQFTGATNAAKVSKVTATNSTKVLGVCVGYYDGQRLVEADCPDGREMAIAIGGIVDVLIESAVTRDEYAYSAATDGQITSSATLTVGAFGRIVTSQDTSTGATTAKVALGLPSGGSGGGGGATFGTPALTLGTTNAGGAAVTAIRTDASIAIFDATAPSTQAFGDTAAAGSAGVAARRDHKHAMPNSTAGPDADITVDAAGAAGTANTAARSAHGHKLATSSAAPVTQAIGDTAAAGTSGTAPSRGDHKHGMPAFGTGSTDVAAGDHTHGSGGGGSVGWTKDVDESGASFANFTGLSGTWASDGTVIKQTNTTVTRRNAKYTTAVPNSVRVFQAEVKIVTAGGFAGIAIGNGVDGIVSYLLGVDDTTDKAQMQKSGGSIIVSLSTTIALNTWYALKFILSGNHMAAWIDGTFIGTALLDLGSADVGYLMLQAFAECHFRNIKSWYLNLP